MEEQLISLKTAILAKEKGFDIPTLHSVTKYGYESSLEYTGEATFDMENMLDAEGNSGEPHYLAPTQSFLQKWLRETYIIDAWAAPYISKNSTDYGCMLYKNKKEIIVDHELDGNSYEDALEQVLYEGLKLI